VSSSLEKLILSRDLSKQFTKSLILLELFPYSHFPIALGYPFGYNKTAKNAMWLKKYHEADNFCPIFLGC
jgi:hypothetical protein